MKANLKLIKGNNQTEITVRKCTKCSEVKPLEEFHKKKGGKYGRNSRCKECINAYDRAYNKSQQAPETISLETKKVQDKIYDPLAINNVLDAHEDSELKDMFLTILKSSLASSTGYNIKEEYVANVLDLNHCKDVNGPDAYDWHNNPWEIKTNFISANGNSKISFGGTFNDITAHKLQDILKYTMAVGVFIDHELFAIATFPASWPPFYDKLKQQFEKKIEGGGRVCSGFYYNNWKDCPDLEWAVLPDVITLNKYQHKLTKNMFDDLMNACTDAMEQPNARLTSRSKHVNVRFD